MFNPSNAINDKMLNSLCYIILKNKYNVFNCNAYGAKTHGAEMQIVCWEPA